MHFYYAYPFKISGFDHKLVMNCHRKGNVLCIINLDRDYFNPKSAAVRIVWKFELKKSSLQTLPVFIRNHPYIMSAKGLGGWVKKWPFLLTFSTVYIYAEIVGGWVRKRPKVC